VFILGALGVAFLVFGGIWQGIQKGVIRDQIADNMVITDGSQLYPKWQTLPVPIQVKYYFYNWMNPWTTLEEMNTVPPIFNIIGPYVYNETRVKTNITAYPNDTVTYLETKTYYFDRESSIGDESDMMTVLNIPLVAGATAAQTMGGLSWILFNSVVNGMALSNESYLYVKQNVSALLYNGYNDALINGMSTIMPDAFPGAKFAIFNGKNDTDGGLYEVYRGVDDSSLLGEIISVDGSPDLTYWKSYCNNINGTDGTLFGPNVQRDDMHYVYQDDVYRSIPFVYEKDVTVRGISAYRFLTQRDVLDYDTDNPDNWCFCETNDTCPMNGLLDISSVYFQAAVFASKAQCLYCDTTVFTQTVGMMPQAILDNTYVDVEPYTGMTIRAAKRLQVNVEMKPYPTLSWNMMQNMPNIIFPVMMFEESGVVDDDLVSFLNDHVFIFVNVSRIIPYICYGVGALLLICSFVVYRYCCKPKRVIQGI
jgi:hypothetical protein